MGAEPSKARRESTGNNTGKEVEALECRHPTGEGTALVLIGIQWETGINTFFPFMNTPVHSMCKSTLLKPTKARPGRQKTKGNVCSRSAEGECTLWDQSSTITSRECRPLSGRCGAECRVGGWPRAEAERTAGECCRLFGRWPFRAQPVQRKAGSCLATSMGSRRQARWNQRWQSLHCSSR